MTLIHGYTIRTDWDKDRPNYEADLLVCKHCGLTIFMCDAVSKAPLPASAVSEMCGNCGHRICGRCKIKLNSGEVCRPFIALIDDMEARAQFRSMF